MNRPEFSLDKALEFVGDNSTYQKNQLAYLSIIILTFATLTCKIPLVDEKLTVLFLFFSGIGQFLCPAYMSIRTITICLFAFSIFTILVYLISSFLFQIGLCLLGLFGRGLFACSLLYIHEIGGDKFRAWSCTIILGLWGISPLLLSL